LPPGRGPVRLAPAPPDLALNPDFENPPALGFEPSPEAGLLLPLPAFPVRLGLGFHPVPVLRSCRDSSPRGVKGRDGWLGALAELRPKP